MKNKQQSTAILTTKRALLYGLGVCGAQFMSGYVNSFQTQFYSDMYSDIDPKIFFVVAIVILLAKLLSSIADPIIGAIIDRSQFKKGKIVPWIGISALPVALLTTLIFIDIPFENLGPTAGKIVMYVYITFTTVCWNIAYSLADIPSQSLLTLLSPDAGERNKAAGFANTFKSISSSIPGVFVTFIMLVLTAITGKDSSDIGYVRTYYITAAIIFFLLGMGLHLINYFYTKERVRSYGSKTVSLHEMFVELKRNKMIRILFLSIILGFARGAMGAVVVQAGGVLIGKVYVPILSNLLAGGAELDPTSNATWLAGIASGITSMISIVSVPFINKKLGERKTFIIFALYGFVVALVCTIFYFVLPADSAMHGGLPALIMLWIMLFFVGFMYGTHGYIPLVMTADIIDYQEWKTGERREGVDYAIVSFANKVASAFSVATGILIVAISGYNSTATVTPAMQRWLFFAFISLPGIGCLLSMIPFLWYKIDDKTKRQMRAELAERRAKAEEEAAGTELAAQTVAASAEETTSTDVHAPIEPEQPDEQSIGAVDDAPDDAGND